MVMYREEVLLAMVFVLLLYYFTTRNFTRTLPDQFPLDWSDMQHSSLKVDGRLPEFFRFFETYSYLKIYLQYLTGSSSLLPLN